MKEIPKIYCNLGVKLHNCTTLWLFGWPVSLLYRQLGLINSLNEGLSGVSVWFPWTGNNTLRITDLILSRSSLQIMRSCHLCSRAWCKRHNSNKPWTALVEINRMGELFFIISPKIKHFATFFLSLLYVSSTNTFLNNIDFYDHKWRKKL